MFQTETLGDNQNRKINEVYNTSNFVLIVDVAVVDVAIVDATILVFSFFFSGKHTFPLADAWSCLQTCLFLAGT